MMQRLLRYLCELTPGRRLLLRVWLALLGIAIVQSLIPHPITAFLGLIGGLLAVFGYSIVVVLGLPAFAGRVARGLVRCSALALVATLNRAGADDDDARRASPATRTPAGTRRTCRGGRRTPRPA
jgi:hypothetical protein